jgi:2-polyprenyl-3-methyl-5-hydroxy-6-metoxy-1,4-benzoquinol methylase
MSQDKSLGFGEITQVTPVPQKVSLNQTYQRAKTFNDYPEIKQTFDEITQLTDANGLYKIMPDGLKRYVGRIYDDAVLYHSNVDFKDKLVCELGARDGIFSSFLTKDVKQIYVSDYFEEWGKGTEYDLGQMEYWSSIWKNAAFDSSKLVIECQDMTDLTYSNEMFDIVVCTSVIEHLYNQANWQGDILAMKEIYRVLKPGGLVLMSTDMGVVSKWVSGTHYYSKDDLFARLIDSCGFKMRGDYLFDIMDPDNDALTEHNGFAPVTPVVFSLEKPVN